MSRDELVLPRKINASNEKVFGRTAEEHSGDTFDVLLKVKERLLGLQERAVSLQAELDALETTVGGIVTFPGFAAPSQGIGGGNTEGVSPRAARSDHDHFFRETSGPTDLGMGPIETGELFRRLGPLITGRQIGATRLTGSAAISTVVTLADVGSSMSFNLKDDSGNVFLFVVAYRTAATTTGLRLAVNYTGTITQLRYGLLGATSATGFQSGNIAVADTPLGQAGVGPGAADVTAIIAGTCRTVTAGSLALRFASGVAGSSVTIQGGSCGFMIQQ